MRVRVKDRVWDMVRYRVWDRVWDRVRDRVWDRVRVRVTFGVIIFFLRAPLLIWINKVVSAH